MTEMTIDRPTSGHSFVQSRCLYCKTTKYSVLKLDRVYSCKDLWDRYMGTRKTLDNNDLIQVVASSGFSENKGLTGVLSLAGS